MNLRVLSVEDKPDDRDQIASIVSDCGGSINLSFAEDRDSAISKLSEEFFDLVILDLKLPASKGDLSTSPEHGQAVLARISDAKLGVSVIILTGSPAEEMIDGLLSNSTQADVWGVGEQSPTIRFIKKKSMAQLGDLVGRASAAIDALNDIECRKSDNVPDDIALKRLIQVIVKQRNGTSYEVKRIGGGLSGAVVLQIKIKDAGGVQTLNMIAKCDTISEVEIEKKKFKTFADRLQAGSTPRLLSSYLYGGGPLGAATYSMADGFDEDLFSIAQAGSRASTVLHTVFGALKPWNDGVAEQRTAVRNIRKTTLNDAKFAKIVDEHQLDWALEFEARPVQAKWCPTHGDFHGGNVLVNDQGNVQIIDYNDIDDRPPSFDWVTLELSLICARNGPARGSGWPSQQDCSNWANPESFGSSGPFATFVSGCRENAFKTAAGRREVAGCAYAYLVRQLGYTDTDHELIKTLLQAVRVSFD